MSGRHRRKTSDQRAFARGAILASVLGSGIALAGNAIAATQQNWNDLADCESGGDWAIDTGNGYYGGLQIAPGTWAAHGGHEFGATAADATRDQQIEVAERILAAQSWGAWPSCSAALGLPHDAATQDVQEDSSAEYDHGEIVPVPDSSNEPHPEDAQVVVDRIHRLLAEAQAVGIAVPRPVLDALDGLTLA
ncbi:transglycosylase family protein [Nocardia brasiliensis]|uniref:transglycosylase family protein n=1 Tax=Nocardia brasiliensis TaxID=37326 RepID=UPI003D932F0B